jgi:hypothetical protein
VGSNPIGGAGFDGMVRQPAERPSSNLGDLWVRIPPVLVIVPDASAGHWRAQVAVTHPPSGNAGSTPARRTVRVSHGPLVYRQDTSPSRWRGGFDSRTGYWHIAGWRNGRRASLRCSCPSWAWEFESPLGDCGRAGARPSLINSECWVRLPGPQLSVRGRVGKLAKPPA